MVLRWTEDCLDFDILAINGWQSYSLCLSFNKKHFVLNKFLFFKQEYYGVSYNYSANPRKAKILSASIDLWRKIVFVK